MVDVVILAVTRLSSGVCVAGITDNGKWIRPTRPNYNKTWRQLEFDDCKNTNSDWIVKKGNIVRMDIREHIPSGFHTEDYLIGSQKPELLKTLSEKEYVSICEEYSEKSVSVLEQVNSQRSLMLVRPEEITAFSFQHETNRKGKDSFVPRCTFKSGNLWENNIGITDAEWRSFSRQYAKEHSKKIVCSKEVFDALGTQQCWFTIGKNMVESNEYLLVVGIHLFPIQNFAMDFDRT